MPQRLRFITGGHVYHILNRAVGRRSVPRTDGDFAHFEAASRQGR